jgi:hypothetical protein
MNDKLDRLAAEMASMRPRPLPADLVDRIESDVMTDASPSTLPSPWPDRFLLSAICSGTIAACVIITMLLTPANNAFPSPPSVVATAAVPEPPRAGDYSLIIARAEFGP